VDDQARDVKGREFDVRLQAVNERLDRLLTFESPVGRSLEQRVLDLERHVQVLRRMFVFLSVGMTRPRLRALERIERFLDEAEKKGAPPSPNGS
jgi:hypothetical protein